MTQNFENYGKIVKLKVLRETQIGFTLINNKNEEFFLHKNESMHKVLNKGDEVEAFLYFDNAKRLAATLFKPIIVRDEIGFLKVKSINYPLGIFLDNGINKDLLLSKDYLPFNKNYWPDIDSYIPVKLKAGKEQLKAVINKIDFKKLEKVKINDKVNATLALYEKDDLIFITRENFKIKVLKGNYLDKPKVGENKELTITYLGFNDTLGKIEFDKNIFISYKKIDILRHFQNDKNSKNIKEYNKEYINNLFNISNNEFKKILSIMKSDGLIDIKNNYVILKGTKVNE